MGNSVRKIRGNFTATKYENLNFSQFSKTLSNEIINSGKKVAHKELKNYFDAVNKRIEKISNSNIYSRAYSDLIQSPLFQNLSANKSGKQNYFSLSGIDITSKEGIRQVNDMMKLASQFRLDTTSTISGSKSMIESYSRRNGYTFEQTNSLLQFVKNEEIKGNQSFNFYKGLIHQLFEYKTNQGIDNDTFFSNLPEVMDMMENGLKQIDAISDDVFNAVIDNNFGGYD